VLFLFNDSLLAVAPSGGDLESVSSSSEPKKTSKLNVLVMAKWSSRASDRMAKILDGRKRQKERETVCFCVLRIFFRVFGWVGCFFLSLLLWYSHTALSCSVLALSLSLSLSVLYSTYRYSMFSPLDVEGSLQVSLLPAREDGVHHVFLFSNAEACASWKTAIQTSLDKFAVEL
jgi:hypothetical protein